MYKTFKLYIDPNRTVMTQIDEFLNGSWFYHFDLVAYTIIGENPAVPRHVFITAKALR